MQSFITVASRLFTLTCGCPAAPGARRIFVQAMRAVLLVSATISNTDGLRASIPASHEPAGTPLRFAQHIRVLRAMIKSRRKLRPPTRGRGQVRHGSAPYPTERATARSRSPRSQHPRRVAG